MADIFQDRSGLAALLAAWILARKLPLPYPQVLWKARHLHFESQLEESP